MSSKDFARILDAVARDFVSDEVNLLPQITTRFERMTFRQTLRARPVLKILLILLALTLLTGVVYAIGRSLGYIPGVGIVDTSTGIRVLAEPVSAAKNGKTVTVRQVVADAVRTYITYRVDGILPVTSGFPECAEPPALQLPDGRTLYSTGSGPFGMGSENGQPMSLERSITYPPLPAQAARLSFIPPCQLPVIEMNLVPAPSGFVTPAVEIESAYTSSGPQIAASATAAAVVEATLEVAIASSTMPATRTASEALAPTPVSLSSQATPASVSNGSGLRLEKVIEMEDAYILIGNFTDAGDLPGSLAISSPEADAQAYPMQILASNGQPIPFTERFDIRPDSYNGSARYWAYDIPRPVHGPLTLSLAAIPIHRQDSTRLQLDVGENPQPGQVWELDRAVSLGGYDFVIEDVYGVKNGYTIHFHSDASLPEGLSFGFEVETGLNLADRVGRETRLAQEIKYSETAVYAAAPAGNLTFMLTLFQTLPLHGPWKLTWLPPSP